MRDWHKRTLKVLPIHIAVVVMIIFASEKPEISEGAITMTIAEMHESVIDFKPHTNPTDVRIAVESHCDKGHHNEYRGFKRGSIYRAFTLCKPCNKALEF